jgi:hypothetical protein
MGTSLGIIEFISDCHLTKLIGDTYRVYNDESVFSGNAVRTVKIGKQELDSFGRPVRFASIKDADDWIKGGKIIYPSGQFGA